MTFAGFIIPIAFISFTSCSQPAKYISDPEIHLAQQFSTRRVIMLADFGHEFALPYKTLVSVLSAWVQLAKEPTCEQRSLTLFLEEEEQVTSRIREYVTTGNLSLYLDYTLPSRSLEHLEFLADLRRIAQRIDSLNFTLPTSDRIALDIQGPEWMNVFNPSILDSSRQSGISYFINQRDSLTAINAITYLKAHPNNKALFFYGAAHLIKTTTVKNVSGELPADQKVGNYLACYLKKAFGDTAVLCVEQLSRIKMSRFLSDSPLVNFLVYSNDVPWNSQDVSDNDYQPTNFDAFILRNERPCPWHPLSQIFSTRIVDAAVQRIEQLSSHRSGDQGGKFYNQALQSFAFVSGDSLANTEKWKSHRGALTFQPIQRLKSVHFRQQLTRLYTESAAQRDKVLFFLGLGFPDSIWRSPSLSTLEWGALFDQVLPQTIFLNCIGIAMIGTPDERQAANKYLSDFSGKSFQEPDHYLKWWRAKYCSASY